MKSMGIPILNASGCLDALAAPEVARALDMLVTKTITPEPREGNPPVRIAETEHGMLNSIGLQGPGIDAFVADHLPRLAALDVELWVSVGGFAAADFARCCAALDDEDAVAAIELNLSCPNVEEAPETAAELVAAARAATKRPLYAKLSPAQWDIARGARAVVDAGADGLSLVNTIRGLALDPVTLRPRLARAVGGYSGEALRPIALACVYACANVVDVPIDHPVGGRTILQATFVPVAQQDGRVTLVEVAATDITALLEQAELRAQREARVALDRLQSQLLGAVSHELRSPLVSIKGYNELLLRGAFGPLSPAQRKRLEIAGETARAIGRCAISITWTRPPCLVATAANSRPMKPAPITTTSRAAASRGRSASDSARVRSRMTPSSSAPGTGS